MTISIITAVLNGASTLPSCLASVQAQDGAEVEHIVVDGASTDGTLEVIRSYQDSIAKVVSEPDAGMYAAVNKGLDLASGEVVGLLNADDVYASPAALATVRAVFADPAVDACYGDLVYVAQGNPDQLVRAWRSGAYEPRKFYWGWMPPHPTFFVRRRVYERYGRFNPALGSAADYELMLRLLLKHRISPVYIPAVLVHMRVGGMSNASLRRRLRANRLDRQAWRVNGLRPYPWTIWAKPIRKLPQWTVGRFPVPGDR